MADRLREALDQLVADGTLSSDQADKVGDRLRAAGVVSASGEAPPADAGTSGVAPSATPAGGEAAEGPRGRAGEVLSYLGGALVVGALTLILGLSWEELGRAGQILVCGAATLLLLGAAVLVGRPRDKARSDPAAASALAVLGAVGAAVTAGVADPSPAVVIPGIVLLVVSAAGYALWKGVALQPAMYAGGGLILIEVLDNIPQSWPDSRTYALVFLAYGAGWLLLERVFRDRWMAGLLGSLTVFVGAEIGAFDDRSPVLGLVIGVVVIAVLFTLFWWRRNRMYAIFGVLTALVVPATALGRIWENALAAAVVLLVVGGALVIAAVVSGVRGRRR